MWHINMYRFVRDRKQNTVPAFNTVQHNSRLTSTLHVVFVVTNAKQLSNHTQRTPNRLATLVINIQHTTKPNYS